MKKKTSLSEEDQTLFRQLMTGTRKIKQDTIVHRPPRKKIAEVPVKRLLQELSLIHISEPTRPY